MDVAIRDGLSSLVVALISYYVWKKKDDHWSYLWITWLGGTFAVFNAADYCIRNVFYSSLELKHVSYIFMRVVGVALLFVLAWLFFFGVIGRKRP